MVLPIATIIFSIALQKILKCPILVAGVIFAIYLILAFTVFSTDFLLFAILYTILAYTTAFLTCVFCRISSGGIESLNVRNINSQNIRSNNISSNNLDTDTLTANRIIRSDLDDSNNNCCCNRGYNRFYRSR